MNPARLTPASFRATSSFTCSVWVGNAHESPRAAVAPSDRTREDNFKNFRRGSGRWETPPLRLSKRLNASPRPVPLARVINGGNLGPPCIP